MHVVVHRIPLVPAFGFGENDLYKQVANQPGSRLRKFQMLATKLLTFSLPLIHGRGIFNCSFGFLPFRHPVNVVGQYSCFAIYYSTHAANICTAKIVQKCY